MISTWSDKPTLDKWIKLKNWDSAYIIMPKELEDNYYKYNYLTTNGYLIQKEQCGSPKNWWAIYKAGICPNTNKVEYRKKTLIKVPTLKHAKLIVKNWIDKK